MRQPVACSVCGRTPDTDESALLWARDTDSGGQPAWVCPACTRDNVRAIEAKLDRGWW